MMNNYYKKVINYILSNQDDENYDMYLHIINSINYDKIEQIIHNEFGECIYLDIENCTIKDNLYFIADIEYPNQDDVIVFVFYYNPKKKINIGNISNYK